MIHLFNLFCVEADKKNAIKRQISNIIAKHFTLKVLFVHFTIFTYASSMLKGLINFYFLTQIELFLINCVFWIQKLIKK